MTKRRGKSNHAWEHNGHLGRVSSAMQSLRFIANSRTITPGTRLAVEDAILALDVVKIRLSARVNEDGSITEVKS